MFFHSLSRSREFLGMIAPDSHSRIVGMEFFHSLPVPELWEWNFFIPFPFPNYGNGFFSFPSYSRILEMVSFHSLPVPELREWVFSIPFPFPDFGNGIIHSRSRSRTPKCHSRSPLIGNGFLIGLLERMKTFTIGKARFVSKFMSDQKQKQRHQ